MRDVRRLENVERRYLRSPHSNLSLCARIRGGNPENELRRALDKVRIIHPLVGVKVVFDEDGSAWFSTDDVLGSMLRVVPRESDSQWFSEVQYESTVPFDPSAGPLIRFVLVYSLEVSDLFVFAKHEICDGRARAFLIRDILKHIADPLPEAKTVVPPLYIGCFPKSFKKVIIQNILKPFIIRVINGGVKVAGSSTRKTTSISISRSGIDMCIGLCCSSWKRTRQNASSKPVGTTG